VVCPNCGTLNANEAVNCRKCARTIRSEAMRGKIACSVHSNREATTSCGVCGTRLCEACAVSHNGIDYCDACAPAEAVRPFVADYEKLAVVNIETAARAQTGPRLTAFLIDLFLFVGGAVLFSVVDFLITGATFTFSPRTGWPFYTFWATIFLAWIGYNVFTTATTGQTLGRKLNNVIILNPEGHIVDLQTALIRGFGGAISLLALGLGYLWAFFDPLRETWHDKMAKTVAYEYEEVS
jgi:uncharacterized RDD family membrane protein YckC